MSQDCAATLVQSIMNNFPERAELFESSLASLLLSGISLYFWSLDYPKSGLEECHRAVDLARPVLKALGNKDFFMDGDVSLQDTFSTSPVDEGDIIVRKRQSQKHRKKTSRLTKPSVPIDLRPFDNLGIAVPTFADEARRQAAEIIQDQQRVLDVSCAESRSLDWSR